MAKFMVQTHFTGGTFLMYFATKASRTRILVWLFWFIVLLVSIQPAATNMCRVSQPNLLLGVVSHKPENGALFLWQPRYRWKRRASP
jgi:hypothetical protein